MTMDSRADPAGSTHGVSGISRMKTATTLVPVLLYSGAVGLSLALIAAAMRLAERTGRLAWLPTYDDCAYLSWGFDLYENFVAHGFAALFGGLLTQHAPIQSLLSFAVYAAAGKDEWSMYAANGVFVVAFLNFVLWVTRGSAPLARAAMVCASASAPVMFFLVDEFRPDLYYGLSCGAAIYLTLRRRFVEGDWRNAALAGGAFAFALLAKPSAFPATLVVLFSALAAIAVIARFGHRARARRNHHSAVRQSLVLVATVAILAGP
jgi:hypothetical protein